MRAIIRVVDVSINNQADYSLRGGRSVSRYGLRIEKLQAKVGELTMANDLLEHKIEHLERGRSLPARRSKP
ncbi:MAG: hypothetical protein F4X75_14075 [Gemmatimonadetes bacterium]|nr:hypothetical protein [Gemmatimonadota bacterium]